MSDDQSGELQFKTLQTSATNSLSLKGLLLIAQFNFQRAAECFHSKFLCSKLVLFSHLGDKKSSADLLLPDSASQIRVLGARRLSHPHRLSTWFSFFSLPSPYRRRTNKLSGLNLCARVF